MATLGIDTSNYTTSAAVFLGGEEGLNSSRLLDTPEGALGLRQSDALFSHVKRLPEQFEALGQAGLLRDLKAVGASTRPRAVEGSYMPCFLAGASQGQVLAHVLGVPFYGFSHQQGHIAAAAWSAGRMDLLDKPHLAWHLSGGTTELLLVEPEGCSVRAERVGGTSDISAGQLIDRTGQKLGLRFPAGKALDELSGAAERKICFDVKVRDFTFSLSGVENKVQAMVGAGQPPAEVAWFALDTVAQAVRRATVAAQDRYSGLPVLCSGGVASNTRLRYVMTETCQAVFAQPRYSTDNAMGIAILAARAWEAEQ